MELETMMQRRVKVCYVRRSVLLLQSASNGNLCTSDPQVHSIVHKLTYCVLPLPGDAKPKKRTYQRKPRDPNAPKRTYTRRPKDPNAPKPARRGRASAGGDGEPPKKRRKKGELSDDPADWEYNAMTQQVRCIQLVLC